MSNWEFWQQLSTLILERGLAIPILEQFHHMGRSGVKNIIFCKICFGSSYTHPMVIGKHVIKILSDNLKNSTFGKNFCQ